MRFVFVGHSAGMLGAERSMFDIVSGAVGDGHDVAVVLPTTGPLVDALRGVGATVVIHPMRAWMGARHWGPPGWSGPRTAGRSNGGRPRHDRAPAPASRGRHQHVRHPRWSHRGKASGYPSRLDCWRVPAGQSSAAFLPAEALDSPGNHQAVCCLVHDLAVRRGANR